MKNAIAILSVLSFLYACVGKDPIDPNQTSTPDFALNIGSEWIYQNYQYDTINGYTATDIDTARCTNETLIDGKLYYRITHTNSINSKEEVFYRVQDGKLYTRSNYLVAQYVTEEDTMNHGDFGPEYDFDVISMPGWQEKVLMGNLYQCLLNELRIQRFDNQPINNCDNIGIFKTYFADGVGEIITQGGFGSDFTSACKFTESRLIGYTK